MDDPTSTPEVSQPHVVGPPTRRRMPVLKIAAVVVVVLFGGLWWLTRPRIDPRFVGTWAVFQTKDENPEGLGVNRAGQILRLDADGLIGNEFEPTPEELMQWRIDNHGRLVFVESVPTLERLKELAHYVYAKVTGGRVSSFDTSFDVITVEPSHIVLRGDVTEEPFIILKRVPPTDPVR